MKIKGPSPLTLESLQVTPSGPLYPNAGISHQWYLFFSICVSAAMDEIVGHFAYVCVSVYLCDPFIRDGAERHFLL